MKTHVFGAKSSLCCAAYVLRQTVNDNVTGADSDVVNVVKRNTYVDDLCLSCPTEEEGVRLLSRLRQLFASRGFRLNKVMSDSKSILSDFPAKT